MLLQMELGRRQGHKATNPQKGQLNMSGLIELFNHLQMTWKGPRVTFGISPSEHCIPQFSKSIGWYRTANQIHPTETWGKPLENWKNLEKSSKNPLKIHQRSSGSVFFFSGASRGEASPLHLPPWRHMAPSKASKAGIVVILLEKMVEFTKK